MKKRIIICILLFTPLVFLLIYNLKLKSEIKTSPINKFLIKPTPTCNPQLIKQKQDTFENIKKTDMMIASLSAQIEDIKKWRPKNTSIIPVSYEEFKKQAIVKNPKAAEAKNEEIVKNGYQDYLNSIKNKQVDPQPIIDKTVYPKQQALNIYINVREILASESAILEKCEQVGSDLVNKLIDLLNEQRKQQGLPTITINPTMKQWLGN